MFLKCVVCVTWDDELRTIKIAILSVPFNRDVSPQIHTDMYVLELRAYELEFMF